MASTFSKILLSGSTNGKPIKVAATSSTGTTIHTAVSGSTNMDEIWLFAVNTTTSDILLTIEYGGTTAPDQTVPFTIKAYQGPMLIIPGWLLQNSLVISAFAGSANVITIAGYVNRITVS